MATLFDSLIAVFLVIATGTALRSAGILPAAQWVGIERLTYLVLFPAVVIQTLAFARLGALPVLPIAGALVGAIAAVTLLLMAGRRPLLAAGVDGPAFTSVLQGAVRWNTFVALALAGSLYGAPGLTLMAIAVAAMIPLLNVLCVLALARYAGGGAMEWRATLASLARNPFIWSSLAGLALNPIAGLLPRAVASYGDVLARAALAMGLLVVGSGLELDRIARPRLPHWVALGCKLALMPLIASLLALGFGLSGPALGVTVIATSVPTATGSYILARQMGGDAPLMAEITTLQTIAALVTMPLAIVWLQPG